MSSRLTKSLFLMFILAGTVGLTGCGQKGPLYLPSTSGDVKANKSAAKADKKKAEAAAEKPTTSSGDAK